MEDYCSALKVIGLSDCDIERLHASGNFDNAGRIAYEGLRIRPDPDMDVLRAQIAGKWTDIADLYEVPTSQKPHLFFRALGIAGVVTAALFCSHVIDGPHSPVRYDIFRRVPVVEEKMSPPQDIAAGFLEQGISVIYQLPIGSKNFIKLGAVNSGGLRQLSAGAKFMEHGRARR
ncbi:hypothetical protein HY497_01825 [Candidatus Woesearchaeota archaeon]|nr:hypothetical protein [Candidatus Woesearchaeota archaeon]